MTVAAPKPPGPHAGKRLSPWRVTLGVLIVLVIAGAGVFALRGYVIAESRPTLAEPWFAGYVDVTATPTYAFESPANDSGRDVVLSFVVAESATSCVPTWGTAYTLDEAASRVDLDRRIARLREHDGDIVVSFGGAANTELASACADTADLAAAYRSVIERYDAPAIDLDIETDDLSDSVAGLRRALAVQTLQQERRDAGHDLGVWLTLPVGPDGLTADGLTVVQQMIGTGVDIAGVNAMTMDYGTDLGGRSMAEVSEAALEAVHTQLTGVYAQAKLGLSAREVWSKIAATPMIGQNDIVAEVFTLADAEALNVFARDRGLGRLSMWSSNRDRTCGPNYGDLRSVSDSCSGIDQDGRSFADTFAPGFGGRIGQASVLATPTPRASTADNPATSPYPIWSSTDTYLAGSKVVWHGNVYVSKWWNRGSLPDNPVAAAGDTPWTIVGPVLPGESPYAKPTVPDGVLPEWSGTAIYEAGSRVLFGSTPYEAKWWTQGDSPAAATADAAASPWAALTAAEVEKLLAGR